MLKEYSIRGDIMLFLSFEKLSEFDGTAFIEIQFCNMPFQTSIEKIVDVDNINFRKNDSLYIYHEDDTAFYQQYGHIFNCGIYGNLETGNVDLYGINYYSPDNIDSLIETIIREKPSDYEVLTEWLNMAKNYNGFYILGL